MPHRRPGRICIRAERVIGTDRLDDLFSQQFGSKPYFNHIRLKFGHLRQFDGQGRLIGRATSAAPTEVGMAFSKTGLVVVSLLALLAAGCQSTRFSSMDTQPAPLQAAPAGTVTAARCRRRPRRQTTDPIAVPDRARRGDGCRLRPPGAEPPANAPDLTTASVAGVWNASRLRPELQGRDAADQVRRGLPRRAAALPGAGRRREVVERRRQAAVALRRERLGAGAALFVGPGKIRRPDLDAALPISLTR